MHGTYMKTRYNHKTLALIMLVPMLALASGCGKSSPDDTARTYVRNIDNGRCKQAYKMVYSTTREHDPRYSTYELFKQNACDSAKKKYVKVRVFKIDKVAEGNREALVSFWIVFHPKAQAFRGKRLVRFNMRKIGRKWYIIGPSLEL